MGAVKKTTYREPGTDGPAGSWVVVREVVGGRWQVLREGCGESPFATVQRPPSAFKMDAVRYFCPWCQRYCAREDVRWIPSRASRTGRRPQCFDCARRR